MATHLTNLSARLTVALSAAAQKAIDLATPEAKLSMKRVIDLAFGAGAGKADLIWWDRRLVVKDSADDLDLAAVLVDAFNQVLTFANVKVILVINRSDEAMVGEGVGGGDHPATDAALKVGGAASAEFQGPFTATGDAITVPAGGAFAIIRADADGWVVTPTSADILGITNLDADDEALYDIVIVGESA